MLIRGVRLLWTVARIMQRCTRSLSGPSETTKSRAVRSQCRGWEVRVPHCAALSPDPAGNIASVVGLLSPWPSVDPEPPPSSPSDPPNIPLHLTYHLHPPLFSSYSPVKTPSMTLVTRSAVRLSRRGGQALRNAKANAAFFTTAANSAQNVMPKFAAQSSRVNIKAPQSEFMVYNLDSGTRGGNVWAGRRHAPR
jgi:hypothetical protein